MQPPDPFAELFGPLRGHQQGHAVPDAPSPPSLGGPWVPVASIGTAADVMAALQLCASALGKAPLRAEYEQWRVRQAQRVAAALARTPSSLVACRVYGSWEAALSHLR